MPGRDRQRHGRPEIIAEYDGMNPSHASRPATGTLRVGMKNAPWAIDVFGANDAPPTSFEAWGQRLVGGYNTVRKGSSFLITEPSQFILIALREVGPSPLCSASNQYQGVLAGVTFIEG
jgi:hypothetical protein